MTATLAPAPKFGMSAKHKALQDTALRWLHGINCSVFAKEVPTQNGVADCLGIRTPRHGKEVVYYIEAKASRSDLLSAKQKQVYRHSIGDYDDVRCYLHHWNEANWPPDVREAKLAEAVFCEECKALRAKKGDTGIDLYYFIVADGVKVEDDLYPGWGVLNELGEVVRRAKKMKREGDTHRLLIEVAHVLVYKAYGKMYLGEMNG